MRPSTKRIARAHGVKVAAAQVTPVRQRTQYTCMSTSLMMCLQALGHEVTEDEVNSVMGARPKRGAAWEHALAAAQHYGCRATLVVPSTVRQLKSWTDAGIPVMIAWNPEGREWSHASVVFDVDDELNVHVADPNIPDPDETVRVVPKAEFYSKWYEKWPDYLVRRPAMAVEREITEDGRQVMASSKTAILGVDADAMYWHEVRFREVAEIDGPDDHSVVRIVQVRKDSPGVDKGYYFQLPLLHGDEKTMPFYGPWRNRREAEREGQEWLLDVLKDSGWSPTASLKTAEPADCYRDGLRGRDLADCYMRFPNELSDQDIAFIRKHYPRWNPGWGPPRSQPRRGPTDSKKLEVLDALLAKRPGDRFIRSIRDQVARGRRLSDKQLKIVRQNLYRNRMRPEADLFRSASGNPLMLQPDYGSSMEERWERGYIEED